jgi:hypothetical protein
VHFAENAAFTWIVPAAAAEHRLHRTVESAADLALLVARERDDDRAAESAPRGAASASDR